MAAPRRSWREPAARAPHQSAEVQSPRHTCAPESYLWALAGVSSSPCSSTAPWQLLPPPPPTPRPPPPAAGTPRAAWRRSARGQCPAGRGAARGATGLASFALTFGPGPAPRASQLRADSANQQENAQIAPAAPPARFYLRAPGRLCAAPCPRGRPPRGGLPGGAELRAREGPPGGAVRASAVSDPTSSLHRSQRNGGGNTDLTSPRKPERRMPSPCNCGASPPPSSDLLGDWWGVYYGHPALIFPVHLHSTTVQ